MNSRIAAACIAVAPLLLGGCTFFHKLGFGHPRPAEQASRTEPALPAGSEELFTAAGRAALDTGNLGRAIEAFQQAIGTGEPRGPALNGLGVAYARLGRADVADELFRQAMAEDPTRQEFAANLALLEQSQKSLEAPDGALSAERADADAPASAPAPVAIAVVAPAEVAPADGRLVQVAPRQFAIRTFRPQPGAITTAAASRRFTVPAGFRPILRIALRPPAPASAMPETPRGKSAAR